MRKLLLATASALSLAAAPAFAAPIAIGASAPVSWNVAFPGPGFELFASGPGGFTTSAADALGQVGTASFGEEGIFASTATPPVFPVIKQTAPGQDLTVAFPDGDELVGKVVWSSVDGGTPTFEGNYAFASSGDPAFVAAYPSGSLPIDLDAVFTAMPSETLEQLMSTYGPIEVVDGGAGGGNTHVVVAEPAALGLLALGIFVTIAWARRHLWPDTRMVARN